MRSERLSPLDLLDNILMPRGQDGDAFHEHVMVGCHVVGQEREARHHEACSGASIMHGAGE